MTQVRLHLHWAAQGTHPTVRLLARTQLTFSNLLGMNLVRHAGCTFLEHLSGVQQVLLSWHEPEYVCNTGLLHSVYGTELFQVVLRHTLLLEQASQSCCTCCSVSRFC